MSSTNHNPSKAALPDSFSFGDGIDWNSPVEEVSLYVELPFWLMIPAGTVEVEYGGLKFFVEVLPAWREVFIDRFTDSRASSIHQGPDRTERYVPTGDVGRRRSRPRRPSCGTIHTNNAATSSLGTQIGIRVGEF